MYFNISSYRYIIFSKIIRNLLEFARYSEQMKSLHGRLAWKFSKQKIECLSIVKACLIRNAALENRKYFKFIINRV